MLRATCWLTVATLAVVACTSSEERLVHHTERGEAYLRDAEIDAALLEFQSALKIQPENAALYERIGDVLMEYSQLYPQAASYYREAHRIDPSRVHSAVREARLIALNDPERAQQLLDAARKVAPEAGVVLRGTAYFALVKNDLQAARAAAERAVEVDPIPPSYAEIGAVYLAHIARDRQRGRAPKAVYFERALDAYEKIDELKGGGQPRPILEQARVYSFWGKTARAKAHFRRAVELASEQGAAEIQLAAYVTVEYARRVRDQELARYALRALVTVDEDHYKAWDELARVSDKLPRGSGDEIFEELLEKRPDDPHAWLMRAEYLAATDRARNARTELRRALERGLHDPALYEALVRLELQLGSVERARTLAEEAQREQPRAFGTRVAVARVALVENRLDDAERALSQLTHENPQPELLRLLALTRFRQGDILAARKALADAMQRSPETSFPLLRLSAMIEEDAANWPAVMDAYVQLLKMGQTLSDSERVAFAAAAYHTGHVEKAREVLAKMIQVASPHPEAAVAYAHIFGRIDVYHSLGALGAAHQRMPSNPEIVREMTLIEARIGRSQIALDRLNRLIQNRQVGPKVLFVRAELLASMEAYEQAEADALLAFEVDPTLPGAIDLLHSLYRAQGKLESARFAFEEADAAGVLHTGARLLLARLLADDGETERAQETLERVIAENPDLWQAKADLAYTLADQGEDLDRAFVLARDAHVFSNRSAETSDLLGWVLLKSGKTDAALRQFERAIRVSSRYGDTAPATFQYHLGLAYRALDRDTEADEAFRTALGQGEFPHAEDARRQLEAARHPAGDIDSSS